MYTYLLLNLSAIIIPLIFTFNRRIRFHKTWFAFWPSTLFTAAIFLSWDVAFTRMEIWGFNSDYLVGINLFGLPLEEWLFFICIPYAAVFTYAALKQLVKYEMPRHMTVIINWSLLLILGITLIINPGLLYTSAVVIVAILILAWNIFNRRLEFLGYFYLMYLAIFAGPFLIVNGILTGLFLEEPIVWYNNQQNLGIRVLTIPVEDFVYGFAMLLMNINIYEWLLARREKNAYREKSADPELLI